MTTGEGAGMAGGVPSPDECVFRYMLERRSAENPQRTFIVLEKGETVSFAQFRGMAQRMAASLHGLKVKKGDRVLVWLPSGIDSLTVWFGINWLGAIYVPINTAYRGAVLAHVIENAQAELLIVDASLLPRLRDIDMGAIGRIVTFGDVADPPSGVELVKGESLGREAGSVPDVEICPWDPQSIMFTSGTSGTSKGVISSYAHLYAMSGPEAFPMLESSDRYMVHLPLFHVGGTIPVMAMLARGGSIAVVPAFSTDMFWTRVRDMKATVGVLLGVMATFILKQPPSSADKSHTFRKAIIIPLGENAAEFKERFGSEIYTLYNMTEISTPLVSGPNAQKLGFCGTMRAGVELRVVDENDIEVPLGTTGELIVRTRSPWQLTSGYYRAPEATAQSMRNGWFHTGDAFRAESDGFYFVDRIKDVIRRRGENISSFEVETEVAAFPDVKEAAIVAVPSAFSEDEVMCVVAPVSGRSVEPPQLLSFLQGRLPHYMLPRYIRVVDALPKTETGKIQKQIVKSAGVTSDTWDREKAGLSIKRSMN